MYIVREKDGYSLSTKKRVNAYCEVLPPVLVLNGSEVRGSVEHSDADTQRYVIADVVLTDEIENLGSGIFKVSRSIHNQSHESVSFKSIFEASTVFQPTHFVFPGFHYDTSQCGGEVCAGEILNTTRKGISSSVRNTPMGLERDGQPWVFAYDREGIPSTSVSEDDTRVFALFASDENPISLESSASIIRNPDGTFRHRIFHPVSEMPCTYAQKNSFEAPLEIYFTLNAGEAITLSLYLFAGTPKYQYYGMASLMEACGSLFPFCQTPELTEAEVWDLGIGYFRFLLKDVNGVPMFLGHLCDRLFTVMHEGELKVDALAKAMEDPENRKLNTFSSSYEIGWAGQGAMAARLFAVNGFRTGNRDEVQTAERCLDAYVSTQKESGLLFPLYGQFLKPEAQRRVPDACNMGWAMCELMRSYQLFRSHGKDKRNYYDFSIKLVDFAVKTYNEHYGFAKTWSIDGTPLSTDGSIGGFMIMGLCEVYRETKEKRYLDTAV